MVPRASMMLTAMPLLAALVSATAASPLGEHRITEGMEPDVDHPIEYTLDIDAGGTRVTLRGTLQIGVAAALGRVLDTHPQVREIVLDSDGGNVYQARALAALVLAHGLDTHVGSRCHSACALVYVAGAHRTIAADAAVGFHCYRLESNVATHPGIDPAAEQRRDLRSFAERIPDAEFVAAIFRCPAPGLWLPTPAAMLAAGVVHEIVPERSGGR